MSADRYRSSRKKVKKLLRERSLFIVCVPLIFLGLLMARFDILPTTKKDTGTIDLYKMNYDVSLLEDSKTNRQIKYGHELFVNTSKHLGPNSNRPYAGNALSCNNCHLWAGTKPYAAPLIGIVQRFPQYRGRENKIGTIEERINGCMERSMNGNVMPPNSKEMKAMIEYLTWLSRFAPENGTIEGQGFVKITIPERAVHLGHGEQVFQKHCVKCHGHDGQGTRSEEDLTYTYPPLWGDGSYNNGAGMTRVITAAQFIKGNMPYGTTYDAPVLTDVEAYDVAGFINQHLRPEKENREKDFPDLKKKPVSTPYGPYTDSFSIEQHQLGPFQPIMDYYKRELNIVKSK